MDMNRRQIFGYSAAGAAGLLLGGFGLSAEPRTATASTSSASANDLVVINQMETGPWSEENCGPTAGIVAMVASGYDPEEYQEGVSNGGPAVMEFRVHAGLSPSGRPDEKSVDYWGSDLSDIETGLSANNVSNSRETYDTGLTEAQNGKSVILHVHHGTLIGDPGADYGHYVVARGTTDGGIAVSDPGRASLGITGYSKSHLRDSMTPDYDNNRAVVIAEA